MEGALKKNTSFCSRREKKKKKDKFRLKINKLSVKENYMKFDQFFVRFALMKLVDLQNVYSYTDKNIYNYTITCHLHRYLL